MTFNLLLFPPGYEPLGNINVNVNGVNVSMSTLCRHLKSLGSIRQKAQYDLLEVSVHGFKFMHLKCIHAAFQRIIWYLSKVDSGQYVCTSPVS